jgi:4-diphosphocytidyl-2C-methyl-D-erythritol kinase
MKSAFQAPAYATRDGNLQPLSLCDEIVLEKLDGRKIALVHEGGFRFPTNHLNPVYQVATALQRRVSGRVGVRIRIKKRIPLQVGFHSSASAAATTIVGLNRLWKLGFDQQKLAKIANEVDPLIAEILRGQMNSPDFPWVLVAVPKGIRIDRGWIAQKSKRRSAESVAEEHFPDLVEIRKAMEALGCRPVQMAGLGPALVGFSDKKIEAKRLPTKIRKKLNFLRAVKACNGKINLLH